MQFEVFYWCRFTGESKGGGLMKDLPVDCYCMDNSDFISRYFILHDKHLGIVRRERKPSYYSKPFYPKVFWNGQEYAPRQIAYLHVDNGIALLELGILFQDIKRYKLNSYGPEFLPMALELEYDPAVRAMFLDRLDEVGIHLPECLKTEILDPKNYPGT